jgi:hypothetical protein
MWFAPGWFASQCLSSSSGPEKCPKNSRRICFQQPALLNAFRPVVSGSEFRRPSTG